MDLHERKQKAVEFHRLGYNCAQCVLLSFSDLTGLTDSVATRLAMGLGGGVGAQGEMCGVLLGMCLTLGMLRDDNPAIKPKVYGEVRELTGRFRDRSGGCYLCRDLKGKCRRPCDALIADGIEILHDYIAETE